MEKKMTKKEMFAYIAETVDNADIQEFCAHEIELLDNKKRSSSKASAKATAQTNIVYEALARYDDYVTISDLVANDLMDCDELKNDKGLVTTQKVSAIITNLVNSGKVERKKDKKTASFKAVTADED